MWTKVTCEKLVRVELKLAAAAESLIGMQPGSGSRERVALMQAAAALLQAIYCEMQAQEMHGENLSPSRRAAARTDRRESETDSPATPPRTAQLAAEPDKAEILRLLCGIQMRVGQLGQLNDAALGFCRGWLSVQPAPAIDYTCEGIWAN